MLQRRYAQVAFTSDADELTFAGLNRVTNGLHVLETKMIWPTEPNTINLRRRDHFLNRIERLCIPDAEVAR